MQAENLEDVQRRLGEMGIPHVKQVIMEGGVQVQQASFLCSCTALRCAQGWFHEHLRESLENLVRGI